MSGRLGLEARWMTFNWRSYIDALSANVQRVYSKNGASRGFEDEQLPVRETKIKLRRRQCRANRRPQAVEGAIN